jgi:hypothetical protein
MGAVATNNHPVVQNAAASLEGSGVHKTTIAPILEEFEFQFE